MWENPDYTINFGEQLISIPDILSYDAVMVSCTTLGTALQIAGADNDTVIIRCVEGMFGCLLFNYQSNCGHRYFRITKTGISFGKYNTDTEYWDGGGIPKHIWGIKF